AWMSRSMSLRTTRVSSPDGNSRRSLRTESSGSLIAWVRDWWVGALWASEHPAHHGAVRARRRWAGRRGSKHHELAFLQPGHDLRVGRVVDAEFHFARRWLAVRAHHLDHAGVGCGSRFAFRLARAAATRATRAFDRG